jgi:hypothetical protein
MQVIIDPRTRYQLCFLLYHWPLGNVWQRKCDFQDETF